MLKTLHKASRSCRGVTGAFKIVLRDFKQFGVVSVASRGVPKVSMGFRSALKSV